jgi:hypothetical protein
VPLSTLSILTKRRLASLPRNVLVWVCALGLLSIAALWAGIAYAVYAERGAAINQAKMQTLSLATSLREHVHGVISNADLILQRMDDEYIRSSGQYALPDWIAQSPTVARNPDTGRPHKPRRA